MSGYPQQQQQQPAAAPMMAPPTMQPVPGSTAPGPARPMGAYQPPGGAAPMRPAGPPSMGMGPPAGVPPGGQYLPPGGLPPGGLPPGGMPMRPPMGAAPVAAPPGGFARPGMPSMASPGGPVPNGVPTAGPPALRPAFGAVPPTAAPPGMAGPPAPPGAPMRPPGSQPGAVAGPPFGAPPPTAGTAPMLRPTGPMVPGPPPLGGGVPPGVPPGYATGPPMPGPPMPGPPMAGTPMAATPRAPLGPPGFGAPAFGAPPGLPGPPSMRPAPAIGGATTMPSGGMQAMLDAFGALTLTPGAPGQASEQVVDPGTFPRPAGPYLEEASTAPRPFHQSNCPADFMRMTVNAIPATQALKARYQLPVGLIVQPLAPSQLPVPLVNLGSAGIVRCKRCRTYVNPFMQWTDGGRNFQCNVCNLLNAVPVEYVAPLDANGVRTDIHERPELSMGCVEYVAPQEYMVRAPMPPCYFFLIDVSFQAVSSGMVSVVAETIKQCLDRLPGTERTQIGFLTFDSTLHFYHLKSSQSQPAMLVMTDLEEPYLPVPDDMLVNLQEARPAIDALLDSLPSMFAGTQQVESATGPALQAAFMIISHIGGKLLLFQSTVPSLGVGKIKNRDNNSLYGTDREYTLRTPDDPFWKKYAAEASRQQISVDVFSFSANYADLASIGALPKYTCGSLYYYPGFNAARDATKLQAELSHNLVRETGWEAVMRIRCSKGLRISQFHGHFFIRSSDLLALPAVDPDKAFAVQISHEETMVAYIQAALLYTASCGERRIRVATTMVPVVQELADLYRATDGGAQAALTARLAVEKSFGTKLDDARNECQQRLVATLKEFRIIQAQVSRAAGGMHNQLLYPDTLKFLPVWTLGILKSSALRGTGSTVQSDERTAIAHEIMALGVPGLLRLIYPTVYHVSDVSGAWGTQAPGQAVVMPSTVPASLVYLDPQGAYLLDTGRVLVLWLSRGVSADFMRQIFGVEAGQQEPTVLAVEPARAGSELSARINRVVGALRAGRATHQQVFVVRQGSHMEAHVLPYFVEDRSVGTVSYLDFLQTLHKAVLAKA